MDLIATRRIVDQGPRDARDRVPTSIATLEARFDAWPSPSYVVQACCPVPDRACRDLTLWFYEHRDDGGIEERLEFPS